MKIIKSKKAAEINQQMIMSVLSIILIFILFLFAIKSCGSLLEKQRGVILTDLEGDMQSAVELLSSGYGSVEHKQFLLPEGTESVCFLDLSHSETILKDTSLPLEYPLINQSLAAGDKKNVFLIKNYQITESFYGGNICLDYYPFYSCIATKGNVLDLWFEGRAGCITLYINWSSFQENFKNMTLYDGNPLFLVQEQRTDTIDNWREISAVVPLALFQENRINPQPSKYSYNYSVFYKTYLEQSNIESLMRDYSANKAYLFDNTQTFPIQNLSYKTTRDPNYFKFWKNYSSLIMIDASNRDSAVIGSLLAAFVNAPLIFVNASNIATFTPSIVGKQVFIIRHSLIKPALDAVTYETVKTLSSRYQEIFDSLLQSEGSIYTFAKLNSTITVT